jgi:hypothetical protein
MICTELFTAAEIPGYVRVNVHRHELKRAKVIHRAIIGKNPSGEQVPRGKNINCSSGTITVSASKPRRLLESPAQSEVDLQISSWRLPVEAR